MDAIAINDNFIIYYGNRVGYIKQKKACVDPMFHKPDLEEYLTKKRLEVEWKEGVYDEITNHPEIDPESTEEPGKEQLRLRIHQLKPDTDPLMKFIAYDELILKGFGKPRRKNYTLAFDTTTDTSDLNKILEKYENKVPPDFHGHLLAMSDIIELYDNADSKFYYIDKKGFKEIDFSQESEDSKSKPEQPDKKPNAVDHKNLNTSFIL